jgi:hypothetical protein
MKLVLSLNIHLTSPLNTLHKRLGLEASGLKFQVCCVSDMNVNILFWCEECMHNNQNNFQHPL